MAAAGRMSVVGSRLRVLASASAASSARSAPALPAGKVRLALGLEKQTENGRLFVKQEIDAMFSHIGGTFEEATLLKRLPAASDTLVAAKGGDCKDESVPELWGPEGKRCKVPEWAKPWHQRDKLPDSFVTNMLPLASDASLFEPVYDLGPEKDLIA